MVVQGETFTKERLEEKIIAAAERLQSLPGSSPETSNRLASLKSQHQQLFEGMKRISSLRRKTENMLTALRLKDSIDGGETLKATLDELEDTVKAMGKEVNALCLATLSLPSVDDELAKSLRSIAGN